MMLMAPLREYDTTNNLNDFLNNNNNISEVRIPLINYLYMPSPISLTDFFFLIKLKWIE